MVAVLSTEADSALEAVGRGDCGAGRCNEDGSAGNEQRGARRRESMRAEVNNITNRAGKYRAIYNLFRTI